jgi:hypothetical protein
VPGHEGIVGNETADQLAKTGSEHLFTGPEPACSISIGVAKRAARDWIKKKHWESTTGLKQAKGLIYIWALCQKNELSVEIKQRPVKVGGRTNYQTLPPQRAPFQNGVDR